MIFSLFCLHRRTIVFFGHIILQISNSKERIILTKITFSLSILIAWIMHIVFY
jgi:hypothetical protein